MWIKTGYPVYLEWHPTVVHQLPEYQHQEGMFRYFSSPLWTDMQEGATLHNFNFLWGHYRSRMHDIYCAYTKCGPHNQHCNRGSLYKPMGNLRNDAIHTPPPDHHHHHHFSHYILSLPPSLPRSPPTDLSSTSTCDNFPSSAGIIKTLYICRRLSLPVK